MKGRAKKIEKILVPMDGSKGSFESFKMACEIASRMHAKIQPVSIVESLIRETFQESLMINTEIFIDVGKEQEKLVRQREEEMRSWSRCHQKHTAIMKSIVRVGDPKKVIPKLAQKLKTDLLIMTAQALRKPGFHPFPSFWCRWAFSEVPYFFSLASA